MHCVRRLGLCLALASLGCGRASAAATFVQAIACRNVACAFSSNVTAGNQIYVIEGSGGTATCPSGDTISDGNGDTFNLVSSSCLSGAAGSIRNAWCVTSAAGGATTVSTNFGSAYDLEIFEFSGATCTSDGTPVLQTVAGPTAAPSTGTLTTSNAADVLIAYFDDANGGSPGISAYSNTFSVAATDASWTAGSGYRIVSAAAGYSTTATYGGSAVANWVAGMFAFQAGSGAAAPAGFNKRRKLEKLEASP